VEEILALQVEHLQEEPTTTEVLLHLNLGAEGMAAQAEEVFLVMVPAAVAAREDIAVPVGLAVQILQELPAAGEVEVAVIVARAAA
jgi:hypothetical protein